MKKLIYSLHFLIFSFALHAQHTVILQGGANTSIKVPAGITSITIEAWGGEGG